MGQAVMTGLHAAEPAILGSHAQAAIIRNYAAAWCSDYDAAEHARLPRDEELWLVLLGRARALLEEMARG
jgi:hypothetical protein